MPVRHRIAPNHSAWLAPLLLAVAMGLLASWPTLYGAARTPPDALFLWSADPRDNGSYFDKMRIGYEGQWRTTMRFTSEPHEPAFLFPFHILLGQGARLAVGALEGVGLADEPPVWRVLPAVYNGARFVLVAALVLALYGFAGQFSPRPRQRLRLTLFAMVASGWIAPPNAEAHILKSAILFPHFTLSLILYVIACGAFLGALRGRRGAGLVWAAAAAGFGLAWTHPFDVPPLAALGALAPVGLALARRRRPDWSAWGPWVAFCLAAAGPILYQMSLRWRSEVFRAIDAQNVLLWGPWYQWAVMLNVSLLAAAMGAVFLWRRRRRSRECFVLLWLAVGLAMINAPAPFQRRMIEGWPFALALAALAAVDGLWVWWARRGGGWGAGSDGAGQVSARTFGRLRRTAPWRAPLALALLAPGTLMVLHETSVGVFGRPSRFYYLDRLEAEALVWLEANSPPGAAVWASPGRSPSIPWLTGRRIFYGLDAETVDSQQKRAWTEALFGRQMAAAQFRDLCARYGVDYVYFGPLEREMDPEQGDLDGFAPDALRLIHTQWGAPDVRLADFRDGVALVGRLRAGGAEPLLAPLRAALSGETRALLERVDPWSPDAVVFFERLGEDWNRLIHGPPLPGTGGAAPADATTVARRNRQWIDALLGGELRAMPVVKIYEVVGRGGFYHKATKGTKDHEERRMNARGPRPGNANLRIGIFYPQIAPMGADYASAGSSSL